MRYRITRMQNGKFLRGEADSFLTGDCADIESVIRFMLPDCRFSQEGTIVEVWPTVRDVSVRFARFEDGHWQWADKQEVWVLQLMLGVMPIDLLIEEILREGT